MTLKYNVTGPERKKLVQTIAQSHGCASRYLAAPTFAYQVGAFHISRDGAVSFDGGEDDRELTVLAFALAGPPRCWNTASRRKKCRRFRRRTRIRRRKPHRCP